MIYRDAPPPETEPRRERVIQLRRYGAAWIGGAGALGAAMLVAGMLSYARILLRCDRASPGAAPSCALLREHLAWTARDPLESGPWAVKVKVAKLNSDDGTRPYLAVRVQPAHTEWIDLGARNEAVAARFSDFYRSQALRFDELLRRDWHLLGAFGPMGLLLPALLLLLERRQRIAIDLDEGMLRTRVRGPLGRTREASYPLEEVERVETEPDGEGEIYRIVLVVDGRRERIATAFRDPADHAAAEIERARRELREAREKAEELVAAACRGRSRGG